MEKRRIHDILFIGKQAGYLLTSNDYAEIVENMLTSRNSTMEIIENSNPLSSGHLRKPTIDIKEAKTSAQLYARRAAFAVSKNNTMFVAEKYQESIPPEYFEYFKNELDELVESRKKGQISAKVSKGKPKSTIRSNAMEVDPGEKVRSLWAWQMQSFPRTHAIIRLGQTLQDGGGST